MNFELGIFFRSSQLVAGARQVEQAWVRTGRVLDNITSRSARAVDAYGAKAARAGRTTQDSFTQAGKAAGGYSTQVKTLTRNTNEATQSSDGFFSSFRKWAAPIALISTLALSVTASASAFGSLEKELTAVAKTTDIVDIKGFSADITAMATGDVPILASGLREIAAAAGQVGVQGVENITKYAEVFGKLSSASDLVGEGAVKQLTRLMNVQGEGPENVERLASVIVELGNNSAASESEIAQFSSEVGRSTSQFKIGSTAVAAYGAALASIGTRAEGGGTAIGRTMREIQVAVSEGGAALAGFADVAGVSADEFAAKWRSSPVEAFNIFLQGLSKSGADMGIVLDKVGLKGDELAKVLPVLAGNFEILENAQRLASDEAEKFSDGLGRQTALDKEAAAGFATQEAKLQALANAWEAVREEVGEGVSPAIVKFTEDMKGLLKTNSEAARSIGEDLGSVLSVVAGLFLFAADNVGVLKGALLGLVAAKVGLWLVSMGTTLAKSTAEMGLYTAATGEATVAQLALRGAVSSTIPIFGAQGAVISTVQKETISWAGANVAVAQSTGVAAASSSGWMASLGPLAVALALLVGTVSLARDAINSFAAAQTAALAGIVSETATFSDSLAQMGDAAAGIVARGSFDEMSEALSKQRNRMDELQEAQKNAQASMQLLAAEQKALAATSVRTEREIKARIKTDAELTRKQTEAEKAYSDAGRELEVLAGRTSAADREAGVFGGTVGVLIKGMREWKPAAEEAGKSTEEIMGDMVEDLQSGAKVLSITAGLMEEYALSAEDAGTIAEKTLDLKNGGTKKQIDLLVGSLKDAKLFAEGAERAINNFSVTADISIALETSSEGVAALVMQRDLMQDYGASAAVAAEATKIAMGIEGDVTEKHLQLIVIQLQIIEERSKLAQKAIDDVIEAEAAAAASFGEVFDANIEVEVPAFDPDIDFGEGVFGFVTDELSMSGETFNEFLTEADKELGSTSKTLEGLGTSATMVSEFLGETSSELGRFAQAVGNFLQVLNDPNASKAQRDAAGGGLVASGIAATGVGAQDTTVFGGLGAGNYVQEGAEAGASVGGVYGAVIGAFIGAFVSKSADEALISFNSEMNAAIVEKAEGGLGPAAAQLAGALTGFVQAFEQFSGTELDTAGVTLEILGEVLLVTVNGAQAGFRDMASALAWMGEQILMVNGRVEGFADGLGPNVAALIDNLSSLDISGSFEDLNEALALAFQLDANDANVADGGLANLVPEEMTQQIDQWEAQSMRWLEIGRQYGLSFGSIADLANASLQKIMDGVAQQAAALLGVTDFLGPAAAVAASMEALNTASSDLTASNQAAAAAAAERVTGLEAEIAGLDKQATGVTAGLGGASAGIEVAGRGFRNAADTFGDAVVGVAKEAFEGAKDLSDLNRELRIAQDEAAALAEAVGPDGFSAQAIADVFASAAAKTGLALLDLLDQIDGSEMDNATRRQFELDLFRLQLAAQIASVQILLEMTDLLTETTRAALDGLVERGAAALADPNLSIGRSRGGGGGNRKRERADILSEIEALRMTASGVASSTQALQESFRDFDDWIDRARQLGVAEETLAQARADNLQIIGDELLAPFLETIRQAGETDLGTGMRQMAEGFQTALSDAFALASERASTFGTTLADEFGPLRDTITEAFGIELGEQIRDEIADLAGSGDLAGLQALMDELLSVDLSSISPELQGTFEELLGGLLGEAAAAMGEIELLGPEAFDLSGIQEFLDLADGLSSTEIDLRGIQEAFAGVVDEMREAGATEEDLARVREGHAAAIMQVRDAIMDSVQTYLDMAQSIGAFERRLIDLQETFSTARSGLGAADETTFPEDPLAIIVGAVEDLPTRLTPALDETLLLFDAGMASIAGSVRMHFADLGIDVGDGSTEGAAAAPELTTAGPMSSLPVLIGDIGTAAGAAAGDAGDLADALGGASTSTADLEADLALLAAAEKRATKAIGIDFLGSLDQLGVSLPSELILEMAEAQFHLAQAEALSAALALHAAGAFDGLSISLEELVGMIADADFGASQFAPQASAGSASSSSSQTALDSLRRSVEDQIRAWNRLPLGDLTMQAIGLVETLVQLRHDAAAAGVAVSKVNAAFKVALDTFVQDALDPFLNLDLSPLQSELNGILDQFVDMMVAFEVAGANAEQMAQLQQAFQSAMEDFLDRATQGIRDFLDELRDTDPRVSGQEAFETSQTEFRDLLAAAEGGDLAALAELEGAARAFRENALGFLGGGVGFQEVLDEIIGGLEGVEDFELVPEDIAILQAQADALLEIIRIQEAQETADQASTNSSSVVTAVTGISFAEIVTALDGLLVDVTISDAALVEIANALGLPELVALVEGLGGETFSELVTALSTAGFNELALAIGSAGVIELTAALGVSGIEALAASIGANFPDVAAAMMEFDFSSIVAEIGPNAFVDLVSAFENPDFTELIAGFGGPSGMTFADVIAAVGALNPDLAAIITAIGAETFGEVVDALGPVKDEITTQLGNETSLTVQKLGQIRQKSETMITSLGAIADRLGVGNTNLRLVEIRQEGEKSNTLLRQLVEAMGSVPAAATGAYVERDGLMMVHAKERILNPEQTQQFERLGGVEGLERRRASTPPPPPRRREPVAVRTPQAPPPPPPQAARRPSAGSAPGLRPDLGSPRPSSRPVQVEVVKQAPAPNDRAEEIVEALGDLDTTPVVAGLKGVQAAVTKGDADKRAQALAEMQQRARMAADGAAAAAASEATVRELAELRRELRLARNSARVGESA